MQNYKSKIKNMKTAVNASALRTKSLAHDVVSADADGQKTNLAADQEQYWDKVSGEKEFPIPFQIDEFKKHVSKEMNVLDVGCGYGRTLNELHNDGFQNLAGVDFSKGMINRGSKMYPHLALTKNDHGLLPFPDNTFNAVILIAVLTCIWESEEQRKLVSEILRVLKDDGVLYLSDFILNHDQRNIERYGKYLDKYNKYGIFELPEGAVVRHHTKEHVLEITNDFQNVVFEPKIYATMNGNRSNGFCYIGKKKNRYIPRA